MTSSKFLGITIQENLKWNHHVKEITTKISKYIGILSKVRHKLSASHLKLLYNAMILPYLTYCNIIWGNSALTDLNKLHIIQKKIIRIITNSPYRSHTTPLFYQLKLLKLQDINTIQIAEFMYKIRHHLLPTHFEGYFSQCSDTHSYPTRNAKNNFYVAQRNTELRSNTLRFAGPKIWNRLTENLKLSSSLSQFKHQINLQTLLTYL